MKRASSPALAASLADWLCRRVDLLDAARKIFTPGYALTQSVVPCDRLILILGGSLHYQVEGQTFAFRKGSELYIPAWVRRGWTAARRTPCELLWVEFAPSAAPAGSAAPLHLAKPDLAVEERAFTRLVALRREAGGDPLRTLAMEAELKAALARFLSGATPADTSPHRRQTPAEREIAALVQEIKRRFAHPEALAQILAAARLSANYARRLFREQTGMTLGGYLAELRLREARYLLRETHLPVKEVARRVGYADPLRFSKLYRRFWGHPPLAEREA